MRASGGGRRSAQRQLTPARWVATRKWPCCCGAGRRARHGDGQLVLIVGEPGLGKSRLIEEFHRRVRDTPHTWIEWSCSQLLQNTPVHPIAEWGRQRFGGADVPAERRLADLENTLTLVKLDPAGECPTSGAALRHSADPGSSNDSGAGGIAAPTIVGADELGNRGRQGPAGGSGVGRSALGRPDDA